VTPWQMRMGIKKNANCKNQNENESSEYGPWSF
jgi:hypothetical protein